MNAREREFELRAAAAWRAAGLPPGGASKAARARLGGGRPKGRSVMLYSPPATDEPAAKRDGEAGR